MVVVLGDLDGERPDEVGEAVGDVGEDELVVSITPHADGEAAGLEQENGGEN